MTSIFISYSRHDQVFARKLAQWLIKGGAEVWIDLENIQTGVKWSSAIQDGLDACDLMIVLISPSAVSSINVEDEWQYYLDKGKPVIPLLLQPAEIPYQLRRIQYIDFSNPQLFKQSLAKLAEDIKREVQLLRKDKNSDTTPQRKQVIAREKTSAELWAERPRSHYMLGGGVIAILVVIIAGAIWIWLNPELKAPYDLPEDVAAILQILVDRRDALLEMPRGTTPISVRDKDPLADNSELNSLDSTVRAILQMEGQVVVKPLTVVAFVGISDTQAPLSLELITGEVFIHTGGFPGVNTYAVNTGNVLFHVRGSNVRIRIEAEDRVSYACFSGQCILEDSARRTLTLPEGSEITLASVTDLLGAETSMIEPITAQEWDEWNQLCSGCLSDVQQQTIVPQDVNVTAPTATATVTSSPTNIPTAASTHTPQASLTPTPNPQVTIAVSNLSGRWRIEFDAPGQSRQTTSPNCPANLSQILSTVGSSMNLSGMRLTVTIRAANGNLTITGLNQTIPQTTANRVTANTYVSHESLVAVPGVADISQEITLNFLSANDVEVTLTISDTISDCVFETITGVGYRL